MSDRHQRRQLQEEQRKAKALLRLSPAAADILLVRHGETAWNQERRLQGQLGQGLNSAGKRQAEALRWHFSAEAAAGRRLDAVYSSDLARAAETADCIAEGLGLKTQQTDQLRERHLGVLQGLTIPEAAVQQPAALAALRRSAREPSACLPGGGESQAQLGSRAVAALQGIASRHPGGRVLVVVHGGVLHALHLHAAGRTCAVPSLNGAIGLLKVEGATWVLLDWNNVQHLGGQVDRQGFGGGSLEA